MIQEPSTFGVMQTRDIALGPLGIPNMAAEGERLRKGEGHVDDPAERHRVTSRWASGSPANTAR